MRVEEENLLTLQLLECGPEAIDEPKPRHLANVVLKNGQLSQPRGAVPGVKATDQRCPLGVRSLEHLEELAGGRLSEGGNDSSADITRAHRVRSRTVQHDPPNASPSGWKACLIRLSARL